jgi:hypothetical protein
MPRADIAGFRIARKSYSARRVASQIPDDTGYSFQDTWGYGRKTEHICGTNAVY